MRKLISASYLWGYSIIITLSSFLISCNLNLIYAINHHDGIDFSQKNLNYKILILDELDSLKWISSGMFKTSLLMTIIFLSSVISFLVENQTNNFGKLSLIGATKQQIIQYFFVTLAKPFSLAVIIGGVIGTFSSYWLGLLYHCAGHGPNNFHPRVHIVSVIFTVLLFVCLFPLSLITSVKKLLLINRTSTITGSYKNLSKISCVRLCCGLIMSIITIGFVFTTKNKNIVDAGNHVVLLGRLITLCFYLFTPLILVIIMPIIFTILKRIFPLTVLFTMRYFQTSMRKYTNIAAPIIICLVFSVQWFLSVSGGKELNIRIFLRNDTHITAVIPNVSLKDQKLLYHYLSMKFNDKDTRVTPFREDNRWTEKNKNTLPMIIEINPNIIQSIVNVIVLAGDLSNVHGTNIASTRANDKIGETIHMITPSARNIDLHIIAKLKTTSPYLPNALIGDFASLPEARTLENKTDTFSNDIVSSEVNSIPIFFSRIDAHKLKNAGIPTIPYKDWVKYSVNKIYSQKNLDYFIDILPLLGICLALVIINSVSFGMNSAYIRKVIRTLGGSKKQDLYIMLLEIFSIFVLVIFLAPLPAIMEIKLLTKYFHDIEGVTVPLIYPYSQEILLLVVFFIGAFAPPIIKSLRKGSL